MAPKLRVFAPNPRFEQRAKMDISTSLASVLKSRPQLGPKEAMWAVRTQILANNPYQPPSNGKCPINELPAEILGHIFEIGVEMEEEEEDEDEDEDDREDMDMSDEGEDEGEDEDEDDAMSVGSSGSSGSSTIDDIISQAPLFQVLASHVCRHWREVALGLHVLWTRLNFEYTLQLDQAKAFIDRAHGLPLKIKIDCIFHDSVDEEDSDHPLYDQDEETSKEIEDDTYEHGPYLSLDDLVEILDLIEPEVYHWGEFNFGISTYDYVQCLLSRLHKLPSAPLLKKFELYHSEDCNDYAFFNGDDNIRYLPFHGNAPLLESAVFWGIHIDWDKSLTFLQGLRRFELSYHAKDVRPSYNTFTQIIKNSPDLRHLSLSLSGPTLATGTQSDDEGQWGPEPFEIPSVRYLVLQFHEPQYAIMLVQHFHFPNLCDLVLNFDEEDYSSFVRELLVPVKGRSKSILSGLEKLKISGLPCDVATADAMLRQLTDLKTLHLECFGREELVIFKKLIDPSAGRRKKEAQAETVPQTVPKIFCPLLETLTVARVSASQLKALVTARKNAGAPLKTLRLSYSDHRTTKMDEWLRNNVEVVEYFEPSDDEEDEVMELEMSDEDEDEDESDGDDEDESDEGEGEDEDFALGPDGAPLPSPIAQHLRRRRIERSDLD